MGTRNYPAEGFKPAIVTWPLNTAHIQNILEFAREHNMCVMVTNTGHDFLNRHSCPDGVMIRTSLMKSIEWDPSEDKAFVTFGAGIVFSEAHKSAADNNRVIASGWGFTVGLVGWSLNGGHGPLNPGLGLGTDNVLGIELITATGDLITANASVNPDLFFAMRGGGGSTWGVVTSMTIRAHPIPNGGFAVATAVFKGTMCDNNLTSLFQIVDQYFAWSPTLSSKFGGLAYFIPTATPTEPCAASWEVLFIYCFQGPPTDPEFVQTISQLMLKLPQPSASVIQGYPNWYLRTLDMSLEYITPVPGLTDKVGSLPSVLVPRNATDTLGSHLKARLSECLSGKCRAQEVFHDLTGNLGSLQPNGTAVSPGMRTALYHYLSWGYNASEVNENMYTLGANSYFGESAYQMEDWGNRYWDLNYERLQAIKKAWDPNGLFWCHHCVGDH
jgi:ribonuclease T2